MTTTTANAKYVPAGFVINRVVNPVIVLLGAPALEVRGRKSGRLITVPLPILELDGARYLVGGRGETNWARNLRAAPLASLRRGRKHEAFRATELSGPEHDAVLGAYRERNGARVRQFFEALPDPADHPVFRIDPAA